MGDDRTEAHNNGIIDNASTSIWQQEMNGNQPFVQIRSANPVDTITHNAGIIVNEPPSTFSKNIQLLLRKYCSHIP
jgi:hypothetical protein